MRLFHSIILLLTGVITFVLIVPQVAHASDGTLRRIPVPILMYHYVSPIPEDADDIRLDLTIEPDVFAAHMQYLVDAGYTTISLYELYEALTFGTTLPEKPVILTFDDGYIDHYEYVFPVLHRFGLMGTFFVITGRADSGDPAYLRWNQIVEMAAAGMNMEAHTKTHLSLVGRDREFLIYELLGSQESLVSHQGADVRMLAYPAGHYDDLTIQIADELGFWLAVTTRPGMWHSTDERLELARIRVSGDTGVAGLAHLLGGSWLD